MSEIMVLRHGSTPGNEEGILMGGRLDFALSSIGEEQAANKGRELNAAGYRPDTVFTSYLERSRQTAKIILPLLGYIGPMILTAELNERDFGIYNGKPYQRVKDAFRDEGDSPATVEPQDHFIMRVTQAFERIKHETKGKTLVITHSNPQHVMQALAFEPENVQSYWQVQDFDHCQGFTYTF